MEQNEKERIAAFCINMKEATDRREHCEEQFAKAGVDAIFVRGFPGRASKLRHEQDWITCQLGACISHYVVVEEIRHIFSHVLAGEESIRHPMLVLEDDVILSDNFIEQYIKALESLPDDWDVAALAWFKGTEGTKLEDVNSHWQKFVSGDVWGQAAYIVNGAKGAAKILDCIVPIRSHIDRMFWECCRDGLMTGYFLKPEYQFIKQGWEFASQNV